MGVDSQVFLGKNRCISKKYFSFETQERNQKT